MNEEEFEDYKLEIEELTELLNSDWLDLKKAIKKQGLLSEKTLLVGYVEDEDGNEIGLLFNQENKKMIKFSFNNNKLDTQTIDNIDEIKDEFPQILVAMQL